MKKRGFYYNFRTLFSFIKRSIKYTDEFQLTKLIIIFQFKIPVPYFSLT